MLLSVIIPIYNSEEWLDDCLHSVLDQQLTVGEMEIICVNDGSTDKTLDILLKYQKQDDRIRIFTKLNGGLASALYYGIEKSIRKTGSLTREQLKEQLSQADIFVFPSYVEGLPRVLIEAMALGLPCVATELPGIKELLPDAWLVPVKDVEKLQKKLEKLLKDELLRKQVGENNRTTAEDYSIDKVEKRRKEFYLKLKNCQ